MSDAWIGAPEEGEETAGIAVGEGRGEAEYLGRHLDEVAHADALAGLAVSIFVQFIEDGQIEPVAEVAE